METTIIQRVKKLIDERGVTARGFASEIGFNYSTLNNYLTGRRETIDSSLPEKILSTFGNISAEWLMTGKGQPFKNESDQISVRPCEHSYEIPAGGIPYFADLQVSAGRLEAIVKDAQPSGYIDLPNVSATALFPVVGCSMSPEINPGDVIGVSQVESWDIVDPDKVYLIITHEDRMIKRLAIDESDDSILWCLSPNYPKFRINKNDIKFIYRVTFCGKLM